MLADAAGGEDLQSDAVRILEEDAARVAPFGVRHDALIREGGPKLPQRLLGGTDLLHALNSERQMVKPRVTTIVPALSLLPEGQHQRAVLRQEGEATPLLPGLAQD